MVANVVPSVDEEAVGNGAAAFDDKPEEYADGFLRSSEATQDTSDFTVPTSDGGWTLDFPFFF